MPGLQLMAGTPGGTDTTKSPFEPQTVLATVEGLKVKTGEEACEQRTRQTRLSDGADAHFRSPTDDPRKSAPAALPSMQEVSLAALLRGWREKSMEQLRWHAWPVKAARKRCCNWTDCQ